MRKLRLIGIGAGNPDHLTIQAIAALNAVDVVFVPDKGAEKRELRQLRESICARHAARCRVVGFDVPKRESTPSYRDDVAAWHRAIQAAYEHLLTTELADGECGAFLVWGDPALYDSTLRIVAKLHAEGLPFDYDVIPGISSVQALAAAHRIALNRIGETIAIVPGRRLDDALMNAIDTIVVVLDGDRAYRRIDGTDVDIFWGAYVGTADEILLAGPLLAVADEIEATRERARAAKSWIMDTYVLRKRRAED